MKARGKNTVYALTLLMIVYLLLPTCMAYAAPAAAQKSTQQTQPAVGAAAGLLNPNAPPQGTITIPPSSKDNVNSSTWYTGTYQYIQWTCSGTRSTLVDVTLWQNNQQVVVIGKGIASGQTAYTVPLNMAAGSYELRVTSDDDTRVVAKQPVTVALTSITITAPKQNEILYWGDTYTIRWTYTGNPGPFKLGVLQNPMYYVYATSVTTANGQGSAVWQIDSDPIYIVGPTAPSGLFNITIASAGNANISATSAGFGIVCKHSYCGQGKCTDLQSDVLNCGSCGHNCQWTLGGLGSVYSVCTNGKCTCGPYTMCQNSKGFYCADLTDVNNCGSCGNVCPGNFPCMNGKCVCPSPKVVCGWKCSDLTSDSNNCGKCGNQCTANQVCSSSVCVAGGGNLLPDLQSGQPSSVY